MEESSASRHNPAQWLKKKTTGCRWSPRQPASQVLFMEHTDRTRLRAAVAHVFKAKVARSMNNVLGNLTVNIHRLSRRRGLVYLPAQKNGSRNFRIAKIPSKHPQIDLLNPTFAGE